MPQTIRTCYRDHTSTTSVLAPKEMLLHVTRLHKLIWGKLTRWSAEYDKWATGDALRQLALYLTS